MQKTPIFYLTNFLYYSSAKEQKHFTSHEFLPASATLKKTFYTSVTDFSHFPFRGQIRPKALEQFTPTSTFSSHLYTTQWLYLATSFYSQFSIYGADTDERVIAA